MRHQKASLAINKENPLYHGRFFLGSGDKYQPKKRLLAIFCR